VTHSENKPIKKRIKMIVPVPVPGPTLSMFSAQIPAELIRSDIEVDFVATRNGAHILDSLYEATLADAFCLDMGARAESEGYAAVCINSMSDSGVSALRSRLSIPVVGPGRASFLLAAALGKRFSVITMWQRWDWIYEKLARETALQHALASIRNIDTRPDAHELLSGKEDVVFEKLERACRTAIDRDGADTLVLGSTTMHQSHTYLKDRLEVPILNPGLVAFKLCETLLDLGLTHSKKAYPAPQTSDDDLLSPVPLRFPK
jgi:allantoin racemase